MVSFRFRHPNDSVRAPFNALVILLQERRMRYWSGETLVPIYLNHLLRRSNQERALFEGMFASPTGGGLTFYWEIFLILGHRGLPYPWQSQCLSQRAQNPQLADQYRFARHSDAQE